MKEEIKQWLMDNDFEVEDVGAFMLDPEDDYVDFALKVGESIEGDGENSRGILLCGSGHGMEMVSNKFSHVRSILGFNNEVTIQGRQDEDANVLVIPADWVGTDEAITSVESFLRIEKSDASRHERRRARIDSLQIRNA